MCVLGGGVVIVCYFGGCALVSATMWIIVLMGERKGRERYRMVWCRGVCIGVVLTTKAIGGGGCALNGVNGS